MAALGARLRKGLAAPLIATSVGAVFVAIMYSGLLARVEWLTYDLRFSIRYLLGQHPPKRDDIIYLDIDDKALKRLGNFPLPREYYAEALALLGGRAQSLAITGAAASGAASSETPAAGPDSAAKDGSGVRAVRSAGPHLQPAAGHAGAPPTDASAEAPAGAASQGSPDGTAGGSAPGPSREPGGPDAPGRAGSDGKADGKAGAGASGGGERGEIGRGAAAIGFDIFFTEDSVGRITQKDINRALEEISGILRKGGGDEAVARVLDGLLSRPDREMSRLAALHGHTFFPTFLESEIQYLGRSAMEREIRRRKPVAEAAAAILEEKGNERLAKLWETNRPAAAFELAERLKSKRGMDPRLLDILGRKMVEDAIHDRLVGRVKSILSGPGEINAFVTGGSEDPVKKLLAAGLTEDQIAKAELAMAWELQLEEYWGYYLAAYSSNPPMTFVDYLEKVVRNLREEGRKRELKKAMALPPDHPDREALIAEYSRPVICEYETAISPYMDIDYGLRRRIGRLKLREAAEEDFDALSHSPTVVAPIIPLTEAARMPSFVQFVPEVDGVVRRFPMLMVHLPPEDLLAGKRGTLYPSLGLAICMDLLGVRFEDIVVRPGKEILLPGARDPRTGRRFDLSIPIDEHGRMFINWVAPWVDENDLPHVSLGDLLERDNETGRLTETAIKRAALFRDKIAIIGLTGTGTHDMNPIPLQARYPLVGAHGNVINTILTGRFIRQVPAALNAALVLGVTLLLGLALTRLERLWALAGFVILAAAYFATAYAAFAFGGLVVDVAHAEGALLCTSLGMFVYRYMTEERRRRQYRGVLQYYLAPDVVEEQLKDPDSIRLGGQKREVTALFSDIEKFSTISEKVGDPEKLVKLMSHYFDVACAPMWNRKAVIDKFIGDAIVAFWNAPKALPDHALQACLAALETKRAEASLEPLVREFGLPFPLRTRIGINTGEVTVGNMGSPTKFNYTILGDAANLASRLEGANKAFRTYIMIGESTYEQAKDGIEAREVDRVVVVGKTQPIRVYELLGAKGELREPWPEVLELFAKARTAYLKREFEKAAGLFAMILDKVPGDGPSEVYLQRCRVYMMKAPPPDWDGTTKLTEK